MRWINIIISALAVWFLQLLLIDSLSISSVRPDFCAILILYWSLIYGRTFGICSGFLFGLIVDLSISGIFFGLSPLIYTITGYLGGGLNINSIKLNPFYTSLTWILIFFFHFFVVLLRVLLIILINLSPANVPPRHTSISSPSTQFIDPSFLV